MRNSVAAWLLESNIELQWVHDHLEKAIDDIGIKTLVPIIQQQSSAKRDSQLKQAFQDAAIVLPEAAVRTNPGHEAKGQKTSISHATEMTQINDFRGVYLTNGAGSCAWLRENQTISPDELGVLVIGALPIETALPTTTFALPCCHAQQQQVLLQVTLVQFGNKLIKVKEWDQTTL